MFLYISCEFYIPSPANDLSSAQGYDENGNIFVEKIDGLTMVRKMAIEVQIMMQHKIDAIKRIMELAENIALDHKYDKDRGERLKEGMYTYYNAKKLNILEEDDDGTGDEYSRFLSQYRDKEDQYYAPGYSRMMLTANKHFSGIPVNTSFSSVHVPTNVFDGEPKVINAIDWSRKLDDTFKDNYQRDPSLSWQFFGSSTGFLRQVNNFMAIFFVNTIIPFIMTMTVLAVPCDEVVDVRGRPGHVRREDAGLVHQVRRQP